MEKIDTIFQTFYIEFLTDLKELYNITFIESDLIDNKPKTLKCKLLLNNKPFLEIESKDITWGVKSINGKLSNLDIILNKYIKDKNLLSEHDKMKHTPLVLRTWLWDAIYNYVLI